MHAVGGDSRVVAPGLPGDGSFHDPEVLSTDVERHDVIVFRHLTEDNLKHVVELEVAKVRERLADKGLELDLTDDAKAFLVKKGSNTDYGARPLRRAIESFIEDPLAEELLKGEFAGKDTIRVEVKKVGDKKQLVFEGAQTKESEPEPVGAGVGEGEEPSGEGEG